MKKEKANLLGRGSGPGCGKGSSSQETPEKRFKKQADSTKILKNLPGCVVDCAKPFFIGKGFSLTSQPDNP